MNRLVELCEELLTDARYEVERARLLADEGRGDEARFYAGLAYAHRSDAQRLRGALLEARGLVRNLQGGDEPAEQVGALGGYRD